MTPTEVARDANGPPLAYVYSKANEAEAIQAVLTEDEARRVAVGATPAGPPAGLAARPAGAPNRDWRSGCGMKHYPPQPDAGRGGANRAPD
jgi:hypothetical protein